MADSVAIHHQKIMVMLSGGLILLSDPKYPHETFGIDLPEGGNQQPMKLRNNIIVRAILRQVKVIAYCQKTRAAAVSFINGPEQ